MADALERIFPMALPNGVLGRAAVRLAQKREPNVARNLAPPLEGLS